MRVTRRCIVKGILSTAFAAVAPSIVRAQTIRAEGLVTGGNVDNWEAFDGLLKEAERRGRGDIEIPPGIFLVTPRNKKPALILPANVSLRGAGRDQTTILIGPGVTGHGINATFGYAEISDLTIDGNESLRELMVGHNIRIGGEKVTVERVHSKNSPSYGIAISQRNYARDIVIRDTLVENVGADGIDVKNRLSRTAGILIENVTVRGFGRPRRALDRNLIGTNADDRGDKAAVDLRGICEVRNLTIDGILRDRDGLRFRPGEAGGKGQLGAHGSKASGVRIRAEPGELGANGIIVVARDVTISDIDIIGVDSALAVIAENAKVLGGTVMNSRFAIKTRGNKYGKPGELRVSDVKFERSGLSVNDAVPPPTFENCIFSDCRGSAEALLKSANANISTSSFDNSCKR